MNCHAPAGRVRLRVFMLRMLIGNRGGRLRADIR
jgi:hypothetical protein